MSPETKLKRHLKDYRPPEFQIPETTMDIDLHEERTRVTTRLTFSASPAVRAAAAAGTPVPALVLNGRDLKLIRILLNDRKLTPEEYHLETSAAGGTPGAVPDTRSADLLIINAPPLDGRLETEVELNPAGNRALTGLYWKDRIFCTQNEPEGFRRITWFCDRPDILSRFTVTIRGDRTTYPWLLSNGNQQAAGTLPNNRHYTIWQDPYPKPCYLFALVAGDFAVTEDTHITASGRPVTLQIFTDHGNEHRVEFTMDTLKRAMRWDEETYGLEYQLDIFMIVAVASFNSGAMENTGLNIYNTVLALADRETATDQQFQLIERVVCHEFFHNWTGNRVTCRDWFQITLKEGLTIYRDEEFHIAHNGGSTARIAMVNEIRQSQFIEDAGPLAHPVRPESYLAINNFYTTTVYKKGKEIIRMIRTLIDTNRFNQGLRNFLHRYDGQAVTVEDFVGAMEDVSGMDLSRMMDWYRRAGTPVCRVETAYNPVTRTYRLTVRQHLKPIGTTPDHLSSLPFLFPLRIGLLDTDGNEIKLIPDAPPNRLSPEILIITQEEQEFTFREVPAPPVPSLLRGFSAPVILEYDYTPDELIFLLQHDTDMWNRYDAGQRLMLNVLRDSALKWRSGSTSEIPEEILTVLAAMPTPTPDDPALTSRLLEVPSVEMIAMNLPGFDAVAAQAARTAFRRALAHAAAPALLTCYRSMAPESAGTESNSWLSPTALARRSLRNTCLSLLATLGGTYRELAIHHYEQSDTLTDRLAAMTALANTRDLYHTRAFRDYYGHWHADPIMIGHWFAIQAAADSNTILDDVLTLAEDPAFDRSNPTALRNLFGTYAANLSRFHRPDERGYRLIADLVIEQDAGNPQLAARLAKLFMHYPRLGEPQRTMLQSELDRILQQPSISNDLYEIIENTLHTSTRLEGDNHANNRNS